MLTTLIIAEILASNVRDCPKIEEVYKTLTNVTVEDLSKPYLLDYFEVYGTKPNGKKVEIYLSRQASCSYGSFGGGGCMTHYNCQMKEINKKRMQFSATSCEAICLSTVCYNNECHQEGTNLSANRNDLSIITGDSFEELQQNCSGSLYTTSEYSVRARYLRSEWRLYDKSATEKNSCK